MKLKNITHVGEVTVSYKIQPKAKEMPVVKNSQEVAKNLLDWWPDDIYLRETFFVLFLNRSNRIIDYVPMFSGGIDATVIDERIIFATALVLGAVSIITAHNHPSGNLTPSASDMAIYKQLKEAGKTVNIKILDNLIITGRDGYLSFADESIGQLLKNECKNKRL